MKRRNFLIWGFNLSLLTSVKAKEVGSFDKDFLDVEPIIRAAQEHLFPEKSKIPSAKSMNVTTFLFETIGHKSYDKDIRAFVIEGARELEKRERGRFIMMSNKEKEKALRAYEETSYGASWLSRIMTLTMEGIFCDPIYGSNIKEEGWESLHAYGGYPRPKTRYIEL